MRIVNFDLTHLESARTLAIDNYNGERQHVPALPKLDVFPDLEEFAHNGLGVAAFDESTDKMLGFLCCYSPWDHAFGTAAKGTFSPIHAHGAVKENRGNIYKRMYQFAAEKWMKSQIAYHAIALYTHDSDAINAMFTYGFGMRCIDAVRPMENFQTFLCSEFSFHELGKSDVIQVREMRRMLSEHLVNSPCFMRSRSEDVEKWLIRAESRDTRLFVAVKEKTPVAFIEISDSGETFVTDYPEMLNICGAFCMPEYRGQNITQNLLNYIISTLKSEGYLTLGVDFESFNPTAFGFWTKHFTPYTHSVVRRIDELCNI